MALASAGFNVFGQLKEQSTCLPPSSRMDAIVGQKLAAGLGTASTLLIADAMASAAKCASWHHGSYGLAPCMVF